MIAWSLDGSAATCSLERVDQDLLTSLRTDLVDDVVKLEPDHVSWRVLIKHNAFRGLAVLALLALGAALMLWRSGTPHLVTAAPSFSAAPIIALPTVSPSPTLVVVDVSGKVRRPGLVRLPSGARVADAIAAAGGVRPGANADGINLARVLVDGEQIGVGVPGSIAIGSQSGGATTGPLLLNSATATDLDALPGIGPVLAQRIVTWRQQHGPFRSVDSLTDVPGIGPAMLARLSSLVRV